MMDIVAVDGATAAVTVWTTGAGFPAARLDVHDPAIGAPLSIYVAGTGRDDAVVVAVDPARTVNGLIAVTNGAQPISLPAPAMVRRSPDTGALEIYVGRPFPPVCLNIGPSEEPDKCVLAIVGPGVVLLEAASGADLEHMGATWASSTPIV